MPAGVRTGVDLSAGHDGFPSSLPDEGSDNVFINGFGAVRVGDVYEPHTKVVEVPPPPPDPNDPPPDPNDPPPAPTYITIVHPGQKVTGGSSSVFINGKPAARAGDPISCGDTVASTVTNVIIG